MVKSSYLFFGLFILFVIWIEGRSKYYKINIRYTYISKFCYNDIWLLFLLFFSIDTEIMYCLLISIFFVSQNTYLCLQQSQCSCVYYITSSKTSTDKGGSDDCSETDFKSDVNCPASGKIRQSATISS